MNAPDDARRSLLLGLGGIAMSFVSPGLSAAEQQPSKQGNALDPDQGEHLIHFLDGGNIVIKVSAATGSDHLAVGTPIW